jgi:hypothetical protein
MMSSPRSLGDCRTVDGDAQEWLFEAFSFVDFVTVSDFRPSEES